MSVARAAQLQPLPIKKVQVTPKTLIVGGGIAGLRAALDIAERGFDVVLVEKDSQLGGNVAKWTHLFPSNKSGAKVIGPLIEPGKLGSPKTMRGRNGRQANSYR